MNPATMVVIGGRIAVIGDRVKHYGQRYGYGTGTATIVGFSSSIEGHDKVLVENDGHTGYGTEWDADRTELVDR